MLLSLSIRNYILIDELDLEFKEGLCVISGDTGSGKSILLKAIIFCLGGKVTTNINKSETEHASVTAVFSSSQALNYTLNEIGIEPEEEISIKRVQLPDNRKKFLVNDQIVTQKTIVQLSNYLFEIHGQNNHTTLLNIAAHLDILDAYSDLHELKLELSNHYKNWQNIKRDIEAANKEKDHIAREIDYQTFVVDELSKANIRIGDEEHLSNIRRNLQGRDKEIQLIHDLTSQLENHELDNIISKSLRIINRSGKDEGDFANLSKNLDQAYNHIEEARKFLRLLTNNFSNNEHNLEDIEEKLFEIRNLARKYSVIADQLPEFLIKAKEQLSRLTQKVVNNENLAYELLKAEQQYFKNAKELSIMRVDAASSLEKKVQSELSHLKMEKAIFKVEIKSDSEENANPTGIDKVRFVAITNPGQPFAPIDTIASGGELSRFMLAFRTALFDKTLSTTIIFDEVDTGIGGAVAEAVGDRLRKLSQATQVLVITHQPQVASKADLHILVQKKQHENHTQVSATALDVKGRARELARMISGKKITEAGIKAAEELLNTSN